MTDLMLDLETLSTSPTALILSIGAVLFDRHTDARGAEFYARVTFNQRQGDIDSATLDWWMEHRGAWPQGEPVPLRTALGRFADFYADHTPRIWIGGLLNPKLLQADGFRPRATDVRLQQLSEEAVRAGKPREGVTANGLFVALEDGRTITMPLACSPRLLAATPEQRANFKLISGGIGINWPDLDEDLSVQGLLDGKPAAGLNLWCHGADFDAPILHSAYVREGLPRPWPHRAVRDTRTLLELAGVEYRTDGVERAGRHHPVEDCKAQIAVVQRAMHLLAERKP